MAERAVKTRNGGQWTEARFRSFIRSALRSASNRWGPKHTAKKAARIERGIYRCAGYGRKAHQVPASIPRPDGKKGRVNNAVVDHIDPVVLPSAGFVSWDTYIERMFCEADGFQILCHECHKKKTADERKANARSRHQSATDQCG